MPRIRSIDALDYSLTLHLLKIASDWGHIREPTYDDHGGNDLTIDEHEERLIEIFFAGLGQFLPGFLGKVNLDEYFEPLSMSA